ncbi:Hypothetical protein NCS54_00836500 [Fusarium falciforme]|uniref:Hypothetical protein n=1 Tax=Fusarium falciforme TaxID=195108 RepID=UPI002300E57F|nr:Hypothetical protein NCS54_00836500 [Fusarium falciforme]WAO90918.1 Hypothetical protein NCS54_00836500 [Fusarium falciforme]
MIQCCCGASLFWHGWLGVLQSTSVPAVADATGGVRPPEPCQGAESGAVSSKEDPCVFVREETTGTSSTPVDLSTERFWRLNYASRRGCTIRLDQ